MEDSSDLRTTPDSSSVPQLEASQLPPSPWPTTNDHSCSPSASCPRWYDLTDESKVSGNMFQALKSCDLCEQELGFHPSMRCRRGCLCRRTKNMQCATKCHHFVPCDGGRASVKLKIAMNATPTDTSRFNSNSTGSSTDERRTSDD